jgi:hypothetical protein
MKKISAVIIISFVFISALPCQTRQQSMQCGQWRWDVKTLTDKEGAGLLSARPVSTGFDEFLKAKAPRKLDENIAADKNQARFPSEKEVVEITAYITSVTITEKDHDFQMILKSPLTALTCFAELPNPGCTTFDQFPEQRKLFRKTWNDMGAIMDKISGNSRPVKVKITGVPFWDAPGGERGASSSGLEIHPVLKVTVVPD